ncbi:MAG: hypothetical protein IT445_14040 [Phycisphaeraceae bacterium]|nr:hypothetical protein [Phycisphaeraceae bacterium]
MSSEEINTVYRRFVLYMQAHGGEPHDWFVGVAEDPDQRLFHQHKVPQNSPHVDEICSSGAVAEEVEQLLLDYGCDGGREESPPTGNSVYAYLKLSSTTDP